MRYTLLLALPLFFIPTIVSAAIAFDATVTAVNPASDTVSFTTSGTDRYLFVQTLIQSSQTADSCTYGGVSMTQIIGPVDTSSVSGGEHIYLWGLANPASGANNVVCSFSGAGTRVIDIISYTGAQQTTSIEATNTGSGSGGTATAAVTTLTDNDWLIGYIRSSGTTPSAGSNTTMRTAASEGGRRFSDSNAVQTPPGSFSQNYTGMTAWVVMVAALRPVESDVTPTVDTIKFQIWD